MAFQEVLWTRLLRIALPKLAAAQLGAVAAVRRSYYDLHSGEKSAAILAENLELLDHFPDIARTSVAFGGSQQVVLRAETLLSELDLTVAVNHQVTATARAALACQIHVSPNSGLRSLSELPLPKTRRRSRVSQPRRKRAPRVPRSIGGRCS